ncbi:unnamed protein product [Paramecium octaurelia]|uniref:Transmembrane protein n=1 Tax=Paramecium octaurelia TaxID=43137 RepID=A0A8S1YAQ0_PAROT|nr:unnamed protein product [Paramecium octaurelia]
MRSLFILFGYLVFKLNSVQMSCQELQSQPFFNCYAYNSGCYFLDGDDEDYSKLQHVDNQIITPSFIIPQQEDPLIIKIIDALDYKNKIQERLICSLIRKFEYLIVCTSVDLVYQEDSVNVNEKLRFYTKIVGTELCGDMDINEDGSLNIFCLSRFTLKQYNLNLSNRNTTLIQEFDFQDQIQNRCKFKYKKWNNNKYIIAFYQCSNWKVLIFQYYEIITLAVSSMKENGTQKYRYSYIDDVAFCAKNQLNFILYLIENDSYLQVHVKKDLIVINYQAIQKVKGIHKALIQTKCQIITLFNSSDDMNQNVTDSTINGDIAINQKYLNHKIYFHSDFLFLQNQTELIVLLNANINQTYLIRNTQLHFFESANLFCQFDQSKNALQFYRYQQFSSFIKPKKRYLFLIQAQFLLSYNSQVTCFRIVDKNDIQEEKSKLDQFITLENKCQSYFQQTIQKLEPWIQCKNSQFALSNSDGSINVSIKTNDKLLDICLSVPDLLNIKGKIEMRSIRLPNYISFQNETQFYIYNCKQKKILVSINKLEFDVLESDSDYYVVQKRNKNNNLLKIISLNSYPHYQNIIQFDQAIIRVEQIAQCVFVYLNDSNLLPLIYQNTQEFLIRKYLQKSLFSQEPILYYQEQVNQKFIQYPNVLVVEDEGQINCYRFQAGQIIYIKVQAHSNKDQLIIAIQNITGSLTLSYFVGHDIHQISNYTFTDYQFSYPFMYRFFLHKLSTSLQHHLAVLMKQDQKLYIAIFSFNIVSLQLEEIIATDQPFFTFLQEFLLYSENKEWRSLLMNEFLVEVESNVKLQNRLVSLYQTDLQLRKQEKQSVKLNILIYNYCYKLFPLQNLFKLEIQKNQIIKLNIYDIFNGPIDSLILVSNPQIGLNGPFQIRSSLQFCGLNTSNFCIKQYNIVSQDEIQMFKAIIMENQVYEIINRGPNVLINYVTIVKQTHYLWFIQLETNLQIQLIQCSGLIDEYCTVISNLNQNLNIKSINAVNVMRTGNLIMVQTSTDHIFIYFEDLDFIIVLIPGIILDFKYIEGLKDKYLILKQKSVNSIEVELIIYQINLSYQTILYSLSISEGLQIEMTKIGQLQFQQLKLVSCTQVGGQTKINFFMISQGFTYLFLLILDKQENQIQFKLQKSIRNWGSVDDKFYEYKIEYLDDELLVLKEINTNKYQYYDLRQERIFYDYFHKSTEPIIVKRINITHFIFFNNPSIHVGTIGFEIEQSNSSEINYNFELHANNLISAEKASFQILVINEKNQFSIQLMQLLCLIFIIIYLRNMKKTNQKQNKCSTKFQVAQLRNT